MSETNTSVSDKRTAPDMAEYLIDTFIAGIEAIRGKVNVAQWVS